ncbi:hypothetical protein AMS59_16090 [Lysinibacillus sp. FJAT-14745]|nr:hypothetical protein AMS59_16090 [Lysinibacillus sp. FJAT-14745]
MILFQPISRNRKQSDKNTCRFPLWTFIPTFFNQELIFELILFRFLVQQFNYKKHKYYEKNLSTVTEAIDYLKVQIYYFFIRKTSTKI